MENEKRFEIISEALGHYGSEAQIRKACEEYAEAMVAILHHLDGKATREEVITEIADVEIMNKQMQILFGMDEVRDEIDRKLLRQERRMSLERNAGEGWILNPNSKVVDGIVKGLDRTGGECPCHNPGETVEDRMCPCKEFREKGHCCCGLYVRPFVMMEEGR